MKKIALSNVIYLLLALVFLSVGAYFQSVNINTGLLITEYLIVLLPAIVLGFFLKDKDIFSFLRLNSTSFKNIFLSVKMTLAIYPIAVFANIIILFLISFFTNIEIPHVPFATSNSQYIWYLFLMAITPALCEEILFRGFFLSMNKEMSDLKNIVYTAFLFALFHFNMYNFAGPFVLGILFAYITIKTNSIYPAMVCHFVNNSIATTIGFYSSRFSQVAESTQITRGILVYQMIFLGLISILCFIYIKRLLKKFQSRVYLKSRWTDINFVSFIPIAVVVGIYIYLILR